MNKDQIRGRIKYTTGQVEEGIGKMLGNKRLEGRGLMKKIMGNIQSVHGDIRAESREKKKQHLHLT